MFGGREPEGEPQPAELQLPVIWLLGKTGAGKTSLVHWLTGLPGAVVGNGFAPCTRTAMHFDFPREEPMMRFLDTRGLGEARYDPAEDLAVAGAAAHMLLIVARLDDPVQGEVAEALAELRRDVRGRVVLVHSGTDLLSADERARARAATQAVFAKALRAPVPEVEVDLLAGAGLDPLLERIETMLPEVADLLAEAAHGDAEAQQWRENRGLVMSFASAAGGSDTLPVVGGFAGPGIQAAMLAALARNYEVEWTWRRMAEFGGGLGTGALAAFGASYGVRQMGKLVPVVGQTAVAAASGVVTFGTTLALGRAAAYFMYRVSRGEPVDQDELRLKYSEVLRRRGAK